MFTLLSPIDGAVSGSDFVDRFRNRKKKLQGAKQGNELLITKNKKILQRKKSKQS